MTSKLQSEMKKIVLLPSNNLLKNKFFFFDFTSTGNSTMSCDLNDGIFQWNLKFKWVRNIYATWHDLNARLELVVMDICQLYKAGV